jgi:hypothetical protein
MVHSRLVQNARQKDKTVIGALGFSVGQSVDEFQNRFWIMGKRRRPSIRPQQRSSWITCGWPIHKTSVDDFSHQCLQLFAAANRVKGFSAPPFSTKANIDNGCPKVDFVRRPCEGGRMANAEQLPQFEAHEKAYNKLARTYTAQVEALRKYRNGGKQTVTVQHVNVEDGGQAIVGNVETRGRVPDEK